MVRRCGWVGLGWGASVGLVLFIFGLFRISIVNLDGEVGGPVVVSVVMVVLLLARLTLTLMAVLAWCW